MGSEEEEGGDDIVERGESDEGEVSKVGSRKKEGSGGN